MTPTEDLLLLVLLLQCLEWELEDTMDRLQSILVAHINEQRRLNRNLPQDEVRITWDNFCSRVSDTHFRRMFRMTVGMFAGLCHKTCGRIGEEVFKSEAFLCAKFNGKPRVGTSPLISGEIKTALSIGMLAGGSHLDLVPPFDVSSGHVHVMFRDFLRWVKLTFSFPLGTLPREERWDDSEILANQFAEKSQGVFFGVFAALDGLAVRIRSPTSQEVSDPGNCHCRKGFFALNAQAMCDKKKRFLWTLTGSKGSTHDSAAFVGSKPCDLLVELATLPLRKGLFIAGDSAHGLAPFLIVPHEQSEVREGGDPNGMKDSFDCRLSSCRTYIECAFGELVMRWGILWRTLLFDLKKSQDIVQVCVLLQNCTIDDRDASNQCEDSRCFREFSITLDDMQQETTRQTGEHPRATVSDNNEPRQRGRQTNVEEDLREQGEAVRRRSTVNLAASDMRRPLHSDMHCNSCGHVRFD